MIRSGLRSRDWASAIKSGSSDADIVQDGREEARRSAPRCRIVSGVQARDRAETGRAAPHCSRCTITYEARDPPRVRLAIFLCAVMVE